jgi:hypothetical protein
VPEPAVGKSQPVMLRREPQQHLGNRQADQLGVGQLLAPARALAVGWCQLVIAEHVQCGQEGIQVCSHERSWMPSSHMLITPTHRPREELII